MGSKSIAALAATVLLSLGTARAQQAGRLPPPLEYVGTTPCGDVVREFFGGLQESAPCHAVSWRVVFEQQRGGGQPRWHANATYLVPAASNPNLSVDGPKVLVEGTRELSRGIPAFPSADVHRLTIAQGRREVAFVQVADGLLHMLTTENRVSRLTIGDGGWSYSLHQSDRAERAGDPSTAGDFSYTIAPRSTGAAVFAIYEGRTPCAGIARELLLKGAVSAGCIKVKWRVTLYQDAASGQPTTYKSESTLHRDRPRTGAWRIVKGSRPNTAPVYELAATPTERTITLLAADDNVLFFMNQYGQVLIGSADFGYALNRSASPPGAR